MAGLSSPLACPGAEGDGDATSADRYPRSLMFDAAYAWRMEPVRERWEARAVDPLLPETKRVYAARRARGLARPYSERQELCETQGAEVKCRCRLNGRRKPMVRWYGCRRFLTCNRCRIERSRLYSTRIRRALESQLEHALLETPHTLVVMMTISLRHSGDVAADRKELSASWRRFRDAYAHRWSRFPFVGVYEVTPGRDGLGHVHAHVLCLWPRGRAFSGREGDWSELRAMWLHAARGRSQVPLFSAVRRCGDAAGYVAKYVAKGVASDDFSPTLGAEVASATYNTRWVFASRHFWLEWEPKCGSCGHKVERVTFSWTRAAPPLPPPSEWSSGLDPPERYQQSIIALPQPHQCGSTSRA